MATSNILLRMQYLLLALLAAGCLSVDGEPATSVDRSSERQDAVAAAIGAFVKSPDLLPPDRGTGRWMLSQRTDADLGHEVSEEALLGAHSLRDRELRSVLSACLTSLHEDLNEGQSISSHELTKQTRELIEILSVADPTDKCDASNAYRDDLFDPYLPEQDSEQDSTVNRAGPSKKAESQDECWGSVRLSSPGLCGDRDEYALVILKVSQAVPHAIMRAPYKVAVVLRLEHDEWVPWSVEAFDSADWTHE